MKDLIPINYNGDRITVLGRDLHAVLEIKTDYSHWFNRMVEYGFEEGVDYVQFLDKDELESTNDFVPINRPKTNHQLTVDMAKEIAMIQRTSIGKQVRQYFIEVEKQYRHQHTFPLVDNQINQAVLVAGQRSKILEEYFHVANGIAQAHALNMVEKEFNVDLSDVKKLLPETTDTATLNPTAIAQQLTEQTGTYYTPKQVNLMPADLELQYKNNVDWKLTESGNQFGSMFTYERRGHSGYQIRWKQSVVNKLKQYI